MLRTIQQPLLPTLLLALVWIRTLSVQKMAVRSPKRLRIRPWLERLGDRIVPSTFPNYWHGALEVRGSHSGVKPFTGPSPLAGQGTLEWSPISGTNASWRSQDGTQSNWINLSNGLRGQTPLTIPSSPLLFDKNVSNSGIIWDNPIAPTVENYVASAINLENGYSGQQTVNSAVYVTPTSVNTDYANTGHGTLNILFMGPTDDSSKGSYFFVGSGTNVITGITLVGDGTGRHGNFTLLTGAAVTLGQAWGFTESMSNTEMDVIGGLTFSPDKNNDYSQFFMNSTSYLVDVSQNGQKGSITFNDGGMARTFIAGDTTTNTIWVYPDATCTVNLNANDSIQAGVYNNGQFSVYNKSSITSNKLVISRKEDPALIGGATESFSNIALENSTEAHLFLWGGTDLYCTYGYDQGGANSSYTGVLQADTSNVGGGDTIEAPNNGIVIDQYSWVIFATEPNPFGTFNLIGPVTFNGTLQPEVGVGGGPDVLAVQGSITFGATAFISPILNGSGGVWNVIKATGMESDWTNVTMPSGWQILPAEPGWIKNQ